MQVLNHLELLIAHLAIWVPERVAQQVEIILNDMTIQGANNVRILCFFIEKHIVLYKIVEHLCVAATQK